MLKDAIAAAEREDWPACSSALLAAWRAHRAPERRSTATVIAKWIEDATDTDVAPFLAAIVRQAPHEHAVVWHAITLSRRAPDRPRRVPRLDDLDHTLAAHAMTWETPPASTGHPAA